MRDPYKDTNSIESRFRAKRFAMFRALVEEALQEKPQIRILDIGGTEKYWGIAGDLFAAYPGRIRIHLVNMEPNTIADTAIFSAATGDACDPAMLAGEVFDIVHSNSVIEHVGDWPRIQAFADNVMRLGRRWFVQTPNYWFPLEPHFRFPGFQWLPVSLRIRLLQGRRLGFYRREEKYSDARSVIESIRLLNWFEMGKLFPDSELRMEKAFGLNKSIIAIGRRPGIRAGAATSLPVSQPEEAGLLKAARTAA